MHSIHFFEDLIHGGQDFGEGLFFWQEMPAFFCLADDSLIPQDPADRVGPGSDLFENQGKYPDYEVTRNHLHVGFRWQPYANQPKNSGHIERELGKEWEAMPVFGTSHSSPRKES